MTTNYRVFLFSSDVGRLTHEADFATEEEAKASVNQWIGDRDWEEELAAGMFRIDERLNGHLKGTYSAYAHAYPILEKPKSVEGESIEAYNERSMKYQRDSQTLSKQIIGHVKFPTRECAELGTDRAIDKLAQELDITLYGRIQRQQRAAGIHERFMTDLKPFGYKVYRGESGAKFEYDEETTVEDLKNLKFPAGGAGPKSGLKPFEVKSGALRVTDPCYSMETWCAGTTENVMNGQWLAQIQYYREPMESYSLDRFNKQIAELENPEQTPRHKALIESLGKLEEGETQSEAKALLDRMTKFHFESELRDFARSWGNPDDWTGRVAYLHIRHESVRDEPIDPFAFVKNEELHVGVDSGQAGFFDLDAFKLVAAEKDHNDTPEHEAFYEECGEQTLGSSNWGVVQGMGAVSSSGYGDGGYTLCERRNAEGLLIEARIVYLLEGSEMFPGIGDDEEDEE